MGQHQEVGQAQDRWVTNNIRPTDFFGRIGGEEFVILLPETSERTAKAIAERIRRHISKSPVAYDSVILQATASFGVVEWNKTCDLDQLMRQADLALYQAKEGGRNRVCGRKSD